MKKGWAFLISVSVIVLDQLSKQWILHHFTPYHPEPILPMLNLMLAFNTGSAFSFLSHAGQWHHWFFLVFGCTMSIIILVWMWRLPSQASCQQIALACILGGALGNIIDRIWLGHVVDFIQIYYKTFYWPVFNLADSAICIGAGLLIIDAVNKPQVA